MSIQKNHIYSCSACLGFIEWAIYLHEVYFTVSQTLFIRYFQNLNPTVVRFEIINLRFVTLLPFVKAGDQ